MLYEALVGFPPFDGADAFSVGYKHVHEQPVPPTEVDSRAPAGLSAIVMRCLLKNPAERYARGQDLADALVAWLAGASNASGSHRAAVTSRLGGAKSRP